VSVVDCQQRRRARADGEGSLYRRTRLGPDGKPYVRWVAQISLGGRANRRIVRRICETKTEAKEALAELRRPAPPVVPQSEQPLGAYLQRWLAETAAPSVSANTLRGYRMRSRIWRRSPRCPWASYSPRTSSAPSGR
jgi:hypothetical protein